MDDLLVLASNRHLMVMDNMSGVKKEMADAICRLSTGGRMAKRKLHTDDDLHLVELQRPVILNGINEVSNRSDLNERCLIVDLPAIDDTARIDEETYYATVDRDKPAMFTGLLDAIVSGFWRAILAIYHLGTSMSKDSFRSGDLIECHSTSCVQFQLRTKAAPLKLTSLT